jgi:hypothetical protein
MIANEFLGNEPMGLQPKKGSFFRLVISWKFVLSWGKGFDPNHQFPAVGGIEKSKMQTPKIER